MLTHTLKQKYQYKNLSIITAMTYENVIGKNGKLPWHLPDDLKYFKEKTLHHSIIMGRKTYESIGKKLSNRNSIILTYNELFIDKDVQVAHNIDDAVRMATETDNEPFIIGGEKIYNVFLPIVDKLYITYIHKSYDGDVFFPSFDKENFNEVFSNKLSEMTFSILERKNNE